MDKTMTVERFDPEISCGPPCVGVMEPAPAGEYVRYADYQAALQARDAEVERVKDALRTRLPKLRTTEFGEVVVDFEHATQAQLKEQIAAIDALLSTEVTPHVEPVGINAGVEGGDRG